MKQTKCCHFEHSSNNHLRCLMNLKEMFVVGIRKRVVISQNQEFFPFPHKLAMLIQIEHLNLQQKHL